jgi:D-alanyl-D-alanine-carboxypeptidase/D-alanyl-D-alanine-endopeptidase
VALRSIFLSLALFLLVPEPGHAAEPSAVDPFLAEATDLPGEIMFAETGAPGMVLVVVRGDRSLVRGYGETEKGNGRRPDGTSLVRLNSITKTFAGQVAAALASDGKLSLTDPLQRHAGRMAVPRFGGREITLLDLATHSAGLPREMGQAPPGANPRAWPTRADRWKWLPGYKLPWAPGSVAAYSNIGFDLLADASETAGGRPYAQLLATYVTGPLGMVDTVLAPTAEQCARLMVGSGLGGPADCADSRATGGSGGLYSTGNDMARWLRHNIADPEGRLAIGHAVYRPRQALKAALGFDEAGPMAGMGLGWVNVAADGINPMLLAKSGAGAGFMSYVVFAPGRDVGVFVAVNRVDFEMFYGMTKAANAIVATLVPR